MMWLVAPEVLAKVWGGRAGGSASQEALDGQVPTSLVLVAEEEIDEEAKHDVIPLGGSGYFWSLAKATRGARWCV